MAHVSQLPVLNNTLHTHEGFNASQELGQKLRSVIRGEVRFDAGSRALYATDASNYRQVPIGLVIPRDTDDVIAAIAACREFGAPILARGGGTSLAGQCCNVAVVLDFSKYMRNIHWLDAEKKLAHVDPGIVLDRVREATEEHHLTFAPDPATHSRCTLGGMIGNNSCGVHALMGGKTVDNIHLLDIVLYDGTRMTVGPTTEEELNAILSAGGRKGEIYSELRRIRDQYADLVRQKFPRIPRRVSGYNLDELLPENGFNVARALVGSEGTCVTVLGATLDLKPSPPCRRLVGLGFADPFIAADHVPFVLEYKPIGLEGFDGMLVDFMRRKRLALDDIGLLPEGRGHLLVEFGGWSDEEVEARVEEFLQAIAKTDAEVRRYSTAEAPRVWHVRESALGSTVFVPGEPHGWEGWEDAAVPPEKLGSYLRQIFKLMDEFGYRSPMYGHFGQGCVHMRINFDLESDEGIRKFRAFLDQATDVVLEHGGSISGEHGDGQARGALLPKMFGPELMQAFREFKLLWDPQNKMNPGKMIDPVAVYEPHENLRLGAGYQSRKPNTYFQFPDDAGNFAEATLRCVGVGACRKQDAGTMCPSYMATKEEQHSTRGRAHLLWEALEGNVLQHGWNDEHVHEALDLCLSCKACKTECPVNVDVATYKAEFLAHYYEHHRHALRDYAFGFMDRWAHLASVIPGVTTRLANLPLQIPGISAAAKSLLGIAPERKLPRFAGRSYQSSLDGNPSQAEVLLWPDTWNNYYHPQVLTSAHQVLTDAGFSPYTPKQHVCCGRPLYDFGFLTQARKYLEEILQMFATQIDAGMPFVFLEPSCASVFRDELLNFFPTNQRAKKLSEQSLLLSEFLVKHAPEYTPPSLAGRHIVLHGHCHHKSLMKMKDEMTILNATGAEVELLNSGCCGMAGPFGFEKEKYPVSQALGERSLLPAVRSAASETLIVTDGFSCREQISQNTSRRTLHFSEVISRRQ